ncbi:MAG: DUF4291 domain-containing protein [Candidatus Tectimicrobiota bacterium]
MQKDTPYRQIRAFYTQKTIRVYQAYSCLIADTALQAGRFISPPFKMDRMTWIKPSFLWMMYRSEWGKKVGQERILAIDISRCGFEWALQNSCLSHYDSRVYTSPASWLHKIKNTPVRIQWDPERDLELNKLEYRSIQVGISGEALKRYIDNWVHTITDISEQCQRMHALQKAGKKFEAMALLPLEQPYPLPDALKMVIGIL